MGCWYVRTYDTKWYLFQCGKKEGSQPTFKFIHAHRENVCSNGWHNVKNHQQSQRRWGLTHRPHHIIVACYCNRCTKYLPFQGEWNHAFKNCISLCQGWTWQFNASYEGLAWDDIRTWKYPQEKGSWVKETTQNCLYLSPILIFHY